MLKQLKRMFGTSDAPQAGAPLPDDVDDESLETGALLVNAYATVRELPALAFPHRLLGRRDAADPAFNAQLAGIVGYVQSLGDGAGNGAGDSRYQVVRHLQRTRHQLSFSVEEDHFNEAAGWAEQACALLFLADLHVRDPQARILVSGEDGSSEPDAVVPHPLDAWARKAATESLLAGRGLATPGQLPPVLAESELVLRDAREVAERALALFAVAVRAESLASSTPIPLAALKARLPGLEHYLTPEEHAFLHADRPDGDQLAQLSWRYESLCVLEWALGLAPALPWPDQLCAGPALAQRLLDGGWESVVAAARLRPAADILDALDLHYRLHWLVRQARNEGHEAPQGLVPGAILERHHALNWLVRFEDRGWDEVDTPT